jgi:hypothetical protein
MVSFKSVTVTQHGTFKFMILLFSLGHISSTFATPVDSGSLSAPMKREAEPPSQPTAPFDKRTAEALPLSGYIELLKRASAELYWGPVYIGNLKLSLTNPHDGYAGPKFPNANHVNFHVDKKGAKNKYDEVVNMHIVKYHQGSNFCLYAWDSVTKKVVFDKCFDDIVPAIAACVDAIKNTVDDILKAADFIAAIAVIAVLIVVMTAALGSLAAVAA